MSYKGHDLDLRPQRADPPRQETSPEPPPAADAGAPPAEAGREPIAVDQVVLDCCNAAHDIARVHGARQIRLEHLLHALTRVAAASALLQQLGVRVDELRRQTALVIAGEAPGASAAANGAPVASAPLEEVLRRAAGQAGKRQSAATLEDVLRALLESQAALLLKQAASDPQRLARWREESGRQALSALAGAPNPAAELGPAVADAVLRRLGTLEAALQSLHAGLAADRTAVSDVLGELRTELAALRASRPSAADAAQRPALEAAIETRLGELGGAVTALTERSAALDRLVAGNPWEEMRARVEVVEARAGGESLASAGALSGPVADRLAQAEATLQQLREETERHWAAARDRHQALEASMRAQMDKAEDTRKGYQEILGAIRDALLKLGTDHRALSEHFTAWRSETCGDLSIISTRVEQLDHAALDMLNQLSDDLHGLRRQNGLEGSRLGENLKRWLHGTGSMLATTWRKDAPTYDAPGPAHEAAVPPTPEAVLSREPDPQPAEKPGAPGEGAKPS